LEAHILADIVGMWSMCTFIFINTMSGFLSMLFYVSTLPVESNYRQAQVV